MLNTAEKPQVVIVGGGFGGLYTAKALKKTAVQVTLIDKRNFHLFQPLLYQVATGSLSPADIASPLRLVLRHQKNAQVLLDEVIDINPDAKTLILREHESLKYDILIVATGVSHHYFGNDHWGKVAPGLKTIEDALEIRRRIFLAFEAAEKEPDPEKAKAWLTFVIVGGGPTGVELAGAIAEIAHHALEGEFRQIEPSQAQILLLEGMERILPSYPQDLSAKAELALTQLGVTGTDANEGDGHERAARDSLSSRRSQAHSCSYPFMGSRSQSLAPRTSLSATSGSATRSLRTSHRRSGFESTGT
jgi:NADH dehydrogenase